MIRHLLRLVWNRKRSNLLIAVEILLSFIVLTAVVTLVVFYVDNFRRPLGFDVDNIWTVSIEMHGSQGRVSTTLESGRTPDAVSADETRHRAEQRALIGQLLLAIRDMPEVVTVAGAAITPYGSSTWRSDLEINGKHYRYGAGAGTDDFAKAIGLTVTRGRWFTREDDGAVWRPVVINERLAGEMFPGADPLGQYMTENRPGDQPEPRMRVVGVITDYRKDGEYSPADNFVFSRTRLDDTSVDAEPVRELVIRVKPGTSAAFEERAVSRLRAAAPDWTFQAEPLPKSRETALRFWLAPVSAAGVVSVFLLLMVAMGLTGVLWLHITQRTREIGLRRAKGATIVNIRQQFVGEVALITTIAVAVGVAIVIQFPILHVFDAVRTYVYAVSISISLVLIYALTTACAWAPGRLASAIEPAEALRYE